MGLLVAAVLIATHGDKPIGCVEQRCERCDWKRVAVDEQQVIAWGSLLDDAPG